MIIDNIFESGYAGNTERALARNMSRAINSQDTEDVPEGIMDFMKPKSPANPEEKLSLAVMRQIEKERAAKDRQDPTYKRSIDLPKNPDHMRTVVDEFAPAGGGGSGNYFQALASAWYNGTFDTGSLQKGIKSQQDVERLLNRGIVCPDGKTRKLHIDYNSDFDGVEIYSDDYYEYGDYDDTIDSRTGQKWGPYDFMAFSDEDLSEGLNEFAADDGDSGGEDDALRNYARMWWAGDDATQQQIEQALAKMGWEIGEDEGGYDNGGVFVVRAGDENGDSYVSWAAEDLTEGVWDTVKQIPKKANAWLDSPIKGMNSKHAGHAVQGAMAGMTHGHAVGHAMTDAGVAEDADYGVDPNNPWGSQGRFVGDTGPAQISTTVPRHEFRAGDRVMYKPTSARATIENLYKDGTVARIHVASGMGGQYFDCKVSDLRPLGRGVAEVAPPGAKAERMVKHIKAGYAKDGKLTPKEKSIAYATAWKAHNKGMAEGFATMLANATSRDDLRQIRNFVTEHVTDKNKQRQIMEQATRIVAVQRRKYAAMSAK